MNACKFLAAGLLSALLPLGAQASGPVSSGASEDMSSEMAQARQEVRTEMAKARAELASENLSLDQGLHFGSNAKGKSGGSGALPPAQIAPNGDFLIGGKAVATDASQRLLLLDYRGQLVDLAKLGIDGGEKAAMAALEVADVPLFSLIVGGLSGNLERRVEASVRQHVGPMVRQICQRLPQVRQSQQKLAAELPEFQPYASIEPHDIDDCEREVRSEFAAR